MQLKIRFLEEAESECSRISFRLHRLLTDDQVRESLSTWREQDVEGIQTVTFETLKKHANELIADKIMKKIQNWEKQTGCVREAFERVTEVVKTECLLSENEEDQIRSFFVFGGNSTTGPLYFDK